MSPPRPPQTRRQRRRTSAELFAKSAWLLWPGPLAHELQVLSAIRSGVHRELIENGIQRRLTALLVSTGYLRWDCDHYEVIATRIQWRKLQEWVNQWYRYLSQQRRL